jgi:hypothetical protein
MINVILILCNCDWKKKRVLKNSGLLGCGAVSLNEWLMMFRGESGGPCLHTRSVKNARAGWDGEGDTPLRNVGSQLPVTQ